MRAGLRLGPFVVDGPIAAGGMGQVWAGHHGALGLPVAIKVLSGAISPRAKAALWAEARAVARIDHPGVIRLLDVGEVAAVDGPTPDGAAAGTVDATGATWAGATLAEVAADPDRARAGSPFLVMERADGTLADHLPQPVDEALATVRAILTALAAAHARGIVHRDVKPANVLRIGGRWVLADFGVAAAIDGVIGARSGTPLYMAPEQITGERARQGPWTDLYAVGCLVHVLLSGAAPFGGPDSASILDAHLHRAPPPLTLASGLPPHLSAWVARLLAKAPADRFRCAADALSALDGGPAPVGFTDDWRDPPADPPFQLVGAGLGLYPHRQVPLVGRRDARQALWSALGRVHRTGDMATALVLGAPGIGKSRLAQWFVERAAEAGLARVVHHRGGTPLGHSVRQAMNLGPVCDRALPEAVAGALSAAGPSADEVRAIAGLLSTRPGGQTPRSRAATMAQWLGLWALERPVIWWIDDAHLDPDALHAVEHGLAVDDGAGLPVLVVLCAREDDEGADDAAGATLTAVTMAGDAGDGPSPRRRLFDLMRRPKTVVVPLDPLPSLEARRLVRTLLHLDGAVAETIERRAAGHPGVAVRWVADRIEHGQLVPGPSGFRPAGGAVLDMPLDMAGIWARRAANLPADDRERWLLELAAALGPDVDPAVWRRAGDAQAAERVEARLELRGLLRRVEGGRWRLVHGPLAEAIAGESLRAGRWASICRAAADALVAGDEAPDPALLARLHRQAGRRADAVGPLLDAARQALDRSRYGAALAWLDEREGLLDGPDPQRARAGYLRMRALRKMQRGAEALAVAEALWADPPADPALWARIQTDGSAVLRMRGRLDESRRMMLDALETARAAGDRSLISAAASTLGRQLAFAGRLDEAEPAIAEALATATDPHDRGSALFGLGLVACRRKQWQRAREALDECSTVWLDAGHLHGGSDAENQLADVARGLGELDAAEAHYTRAIGLARLAGISIAIPMLNLGFLALERRRPEEARRFLRRAAVALTEEGNALGQSFAQVGRLQAAAWLADAEEWAAALAMPPQPRATGWGEMLTMIDETVELAREAGFDPTPLFALRRQWAGEDEAR